MPNNKPLTLREQEDRTHARWVKLSTHWVYSLINYVAAFALIVLAIVIYLEPVSR